MANARSKVVFSTQAKKNLEALAFDLFIGVMNPDEIKHELYSTKVLDYREETRTVRSSSESWSDATGEFTGKTGTESESGTILQDTLFGAENQDPTAWNESD